jgi:thiol-disulfide isomerase/thioredoxin
MAVRSAILVWSVLTLVLASSLLGCGGETAPVTAEKSKFRPAEENVGLPPTAVPQGLPGATPETTGPGTQQLAVLPADTGTKTGANDSPNPPVPETTPNTPNPPPATPADPVDPAATPAVKEVVVSQEVKQMVVMIQELAQTPPPGNTDAEKEQSFAKQLALIVELSQRILQANSDPKVNDFALNFGAQALQRLQQLGDASAPTRMTVFATAVAKNPNADVARKGRLMLFDASMAKQLSQEKLDAPVVLKAVEEILSQDAGDAAVLELTSAVCQMLGEKGHKDEAITGLRAVAAAYKDHKDEKLAKLGKMQESAANLFELDAKAKLKDVLADKPEADEKLLTAIQSLLKEKNPSTDYVQPVMDIIEQLERVGKDKLAQQFYDLLDTSFAAHEVQAVSKFITRYVELGRKRAALVGKPFAVNAVSFETTDKPGQPLDLKPLQGKVLLVNCWGSFVGSSRDQLPALRQVADKLKPQGLEVVSLMFDTDLEILQKVLQFNKSFIPWTNYISPDIAKGEKFEDWHDSSLAKELNVFALPFYILVDKEGKIDSIHHYKLDTERLGLRLKELLGLPEAPTFTLEQPPPLTIDNPTIPKVAPTPNEAPPAPAPAPPAAGPAPPNNKQGRVLPALQQLDRLLAAVFSTAGLFAVLATEETEPAAAEVNPYLAKPDLNAMQLTDWVLRMLDKPKTIQSRPGFAAAIAEACDRVLADKTAKETLHLVAIENKLATLHRAACAGDDKADQQLTAFVAQLKDDARPRVAREKSFFQQERKVLEASDKKPEELAALLKELQEYYAKEKLAAKHLRMASATVDLINKLEDGDAREKHFAEFGQIYAKSSDKELARYGKKLAKKPETKESDLVGKPLELAGNTADGKAFAWEKYRGKVVIVDFWATWCGPCRKEMPNVKALREKLKDKGFEVVGVSVDKDLEALDTYLEENEIPWETLAGDEAGELAEKYGVRGIPTMMLIDQKGNVVAVAHNIAALAPQAEKLLAK